MGIKNILAHYLECALWSSTDDNDAPFNKNYSIDAIDSESKKLAENDIINFVELAGKLLVDIPDEYIGYDFWLTRNHHGAGFWDRGYGEIGKKLTEISYSFGESYLYTNNNKTISIQ